MLCIPVVVPDHTIGGPPKHKKSRKEKKTISSLLFVFSYFNSSNFFSRRLSHICLSLKNIIIGSSASTSIKQKRNEKTGGKNGEYNVNESGSGKFGCFGASTSLKITF